MNIESQQSKEKADHLIEWLRDFANRRINSHLMDERRTVPPHIVLEFGNHGLFGMLAPIEYGGLGLKFVDVFRVIQQVSAIDTTLGGMLGIHNALVVHNLVNSATEEQKKIYLPQLTSGRCLGSFAITEEGLSNNFKFLTTKAVKQSDGSWLLYGTKKWIGLSSWSGTMIVLANEVNEFGKNKGISCFVISSDSPGVHLGDESLTMGVRAIIQNSVHFKGAHVKKDDLLGRSGFGLDVIKHSLNMGRLVVSMASVSAIKRASQIMFRYAEHRKVSFGVLSDSTLFRESFYWNSQVSAALESSVKFICEQFDQGNSIHDDACTLLKIICPELAWQVVDNAMQTLGARGYIETNALPQLMRDVRLLRIFEGPTETLGDSLGRAYISHNSTVLKHLFTEKLNQPNLFAELESLKNRIILTVGDIDDSRIYVRYAILVGYAFIAAVNQDAHNIDVLDWSNRIYKKNYLELEQLLNDFSLPPNTSFLKVFADNLAIDIGNIYQQGTDEERFIDNYLIPDMYQNVQSQTSSDEAVPQHFSKQTLAEDELNVEAWLIEQLSAILKIDSSSLDAKSNIYDLNLDSISSVELAVLINSFYNVDLDEKFLFGNYSVADIAAEITSQIRQNS